MVKLSSNLNVSVKHKWMYSIENTIYIEESSILMDLKTIQLEISTSWTLMYKQAGKGWLKHPLKKKKKN